jgi:hypothetical protein
MRLDVMRVKHHHLSMRTIKECSCCAAKYTGDTWGALKWVGAMDDGLERLELRNCFCGSTLAVVCDENGEPCLARCCAPGEDMTFRLCGKPAPGVDGALTSLCKEHEPYRKLIVTRTK